MAGTDQAAAYVRACYAMSGTDLAYAATIRRAYWMTAWLLYERSARQYSRISSRYRTLLTEVSATRSHVRGPTNLHRCSTLPTGQLGPPYLLWYPVLPRSRYPAPPESSECSHRSFAPTSEMLWPSTTRRSAATCSTTYFYTICRCRCYTMSRSLIRYLLWLTFALASRGPVLSYAICLHTPCTIPGTDAGRIMATPPRGVRY
eukprot:3941271-Rhodomonas_salina.1